MLYLFVLVKRDGTVSCSITNNPAESNEYKLRPGEISFVVKPESWAARHNHQ